MNTSASKVPVLLFMIWSYYLLIQATILKKYTIIQKFKVCKFVWKKLILLFSKDAFTLIKSDSKDIYVECYTKFCLKKTLFF